MILIDTSAWVEFFRDRAPVASLVDEALANGEAAVCGPIETEMRRGLLNQRERRKVLPLLQGCHWLSTPENLWLEAGELGYALRRRGVTPKTFDLLIATHALAHDVALLTRDRDFRHMSDAGIAIRLIDSRTQSHCTNVGLTKSYRNPGSGSQAIWGSRSRPCLLARAVRQC
jgi:predicted nucleic acid-binding protein